MCNNQDKSDFIQSNRPLVYLKLVSEISGMFLMLRASPETPHTTLIVCLFIVCWKTVVGEADQDHSAVVMVVMSQGDCSHAKLDSNTEERR